MRHALAAPDPLQDVLFLVQPAGRDDARDRLAYYFRFREPKQILGRLVPGGDGAVQVFSNDGVVRRLRNRGEQRSVAAGRYTKVIGATLLRHTALA